ncbi:hypothetical protein ASE01_12405 [Nocardioides sp. Root190]|uniref:hypothetical protein n=1 Tax=Nocardioides sp. Root190 TaxID=1736488 RepID=UPI0006F47FAE|nr:hypothetical protein [Nocardioides sp. Root190]KRB75854.1 hypothetical protein ASE01_12405 [Nocardioides sp. Root190]
MNDTAAASSERFLVALGSGLLLIAPLAWTLDATSYVGVLLGLVASLLVAVASGLLLAPALPGSVGTTLMTLAFFSPTVLIALLVLGPASSPTTTALGLGVPAAALSAALATRTALGLNQDQGREGIVTGSILVGLSLALCAVAFAPTAADRLEDARAVASIRAALEGAGVLPLRPDIDGFSPSEEPRVALDSDGYWLDLVANGEDTAGTSSIRVDVGPLLSEADAEIENARCDNGTSTCSETEDGFVVVEEPGRDTEVVATIGRTRLEATLYQREGDLPDPDDVGRALLDADLVDWDGLLRIVETAD